MHTQQGGTILQDLIQARQVLLPRIHPAICQIHQVLLVSHCRKPSKTYVHDAGVPLLNHDVIQLLRQARINFEGVCKLLDVRILGTYRVEKKHL